MGDSAGAGQRKRTLLLSPEAPYPLDGGGALRTSSLLHFLSARSEVDLIAFQHTGQNISEALPGGLVNSVNLIPLRHHENDFVSRSARNLQRLLRGRPPLFDRFSGYESEIAHILGERTYDLAILEHFWTAPYVHLIRTRARSVILDLHNIESAWHAASAHAATLPRSFIHRAFARAAVRHERDWLPHFDLALTTSEADSARVRAIAPRLATCVYPNAMPFRDPPGCAVLACIAFSGNLEYEPNQTGLRWFLSAVWPLLKQDHPGLAFVIVGKNQHAMENEVRGLPDVTMTGAVEDTFPHLANVQICIVPLLSGSGTRLKIVEAWAAGRAVVSTSVGAEGLEAIDGESILLADSPEEFGACVSRLLGDEKLRHEIGRAGRAKYERSHTWNAAWSTLSRCLNSVCGL